MKTIYSVVFFVLILALGALIFFFMKKDNAGQIQTLRQTAGCLDETIADSVLDLRSDTTLIGAFVSFRHLPLDDATKSQLADWGVTVDENTLTFDYMLAKIPTESLCDLAKHENVKLIFIPR